MRIVLIGGNPKGYDIPFDPQTLSGKRLRDLLEKINFDCEVIDMTKNRDDVPTKNEIDELCLKYEDYDIVVFLGRFVERQLRKYIPNGRYLPHPASRRREDLNRLESGLRKIQSSEFKENEDT